MDMKAVAGLRFWYTVGSRLHELSAGTLPHNQGSRKLAPLAPPVPDKPHLVGQNEILMREKIGHIMARGKKSCLTMTYWIFNKWFKHFFQ
jgi:hypothetical protein